MSDSEWHQDQCIGDLVLREIDKQRKEDEGKAAEAKELRELLAAFIDAAILKGHSVTKEQWERSCVLCGRYCHPFVKVEEENKE